MFYLYVKQLFVDFFFTSNCQCSLFSKKNPIIRIFCISGWLAVPINPDKWSSVVHWKHLSISQNYTRPKGEVQQVPY